MSNTVAKDFDIFEAVMQGVREGKSVADVLLDRLREMLHSGLDARFKQGFVFDQMLERRGFEKLGKEVAEGKILIDQAQRQIELATVIGEFKELACMNPKFLIDPRQAAAFVVEASRWQETNREKRTEMLQEWITASVNKTEQPQ